MVHKWLLKRARGKILTGFILVFIVGPIFFTYMMSHPIELSIRRPRDLVSMERLLEIREIEKRIQLEITPSVGASLGVIGIFLLIVGIGYLLATVILEYNKKRRHTHRSKI